MPLCSSKSFWVANFVCSTWVISVAGVASGVLSIIEGDSVTTSVVGITSGRSSDWIGSASVGETTILSSMTTSLDSCPSG